VVRAPAAGLHVLDLRDANQPRVAGYVEIPGVQGAACDGDLACVVIENSGFSWNSLPKSGGLRVVDVSDRGAPRVVGSLDLKDAAHVAMRGRLAFVTTTPAAGGGGPNNAQAGLHVVDLSDPARPRVIGWCALPATSTMRARPRPSPCAAISCTCPRATAARPLWR
jgi:hypothetical protein